MSNDHGEFDETCTESKTTGTVGNFPHGSRETPETSFLAWKRIGRRRREATIPTWTLPGSPQFHSTEEAGEQGQGARPAESVEGRELTKENTEQSLLDRTQSRNRAGDRS